MQNQVQDWKVSDVTDSDHNVLTYKISRTSTAQTVPTKRRYNSRKADWEKFTSTLIQYKNMNMINDGSIDDHARTIIKVIEIAANK